MTNSKKPLGGGGASCKEIFLENLFFLKNFKQAEVCEFVRAMRGASADRTKPFQTAVAAKALGEGSEAISDCTGRFKRVKTKIAFTLAETLITLAIIGIVAALTIPTVVTKYNQHAQYTAFMKVYNTLSNAAQLSTNDNGSLEELEQNFDDEDVFKKYLGNYLKISAYCKGNASACIPGGAYSIKPLNFEGAGEMDIYSALDSLTSALLDDGTLIYHVSHAVFYVDTNGTKGPNTMGRDVIAFEVIEYKNKYVIAPYILYKYGEDESYTLEELTETGSNPEVICSTTVSSTGDSCGARMLLQGKMDY